MRKWLVYTLLLGLATDAFARAGGGGSYRSSSGSSSRSSSSSSSRSSSSSSSSYKSSSGSSYKSSSGTSSQRSSGSYSSGPSYKYPELKAQTRTYSFANRGKINIAQTVVFAFAGTQSDGLRITNGVPETPVQAEAVVYDKQQITTATNDSVYFTFKLAKPAAADNSLSFINQMSYAPTPTADGVTFAITALCGREPQCNVKFRGLSPLTRILLMAKDLKNKGGYAIKAERAGSDFEFSKAELTGIHHLRLIIPDADMRAAAVEAWAKADIVAESESAVEIGADGEIGFSEKMAYARSSAINYLPIMNGPAAKERYLISKVKGIDDSHFSEYGDSYFSLRAGSTGYSYSVIHAATTSGQEKRIRLPLPAPTPNLYGMTDLQRNTGYIQQHKRIIISMPAGMRVQPQITECLRFSYTGCTETRPITIRTELTEDKLVLYPQEAQTTGLWLLDIEIPDGKIPEPGLWKKIAFSFGHYHYFGKHPRWVFWFYFFAILLGLIALIAFFMKLGALKRTRAARQKAAAQEASALGELRKRDPAFDAEAFKARGRLISEKIQHAWSAGDMRECRRYLSQGVYNRFRTQLKIMREFEKRQNAMTDFTINAFNIVAHKRSGLFDALVVRLDAAARDVMVAGSLSAEEAQKAASKAPQNIFVEYYTFMRRRDAKTEAPQNIDSCSHCGTPFTGEGEITKCKSCGAVMGSGTFDWVLAEITQEVEYGKGKRFKMPSQELSGDRIEDRASFIFWRDVLTGITGKRDFLLRDATDAYLEKKRAAASWKDVSVGAADIEAYDDALSPIRASVRIKWSAKGPGDREIRHRESVLSLVAEPQNEGGSGFADHSCETCGAPLPETDAEACAYCRSPIQRKNKDWLLDQVETTVE